MVTVDEGQKRRTNRLRGIRIRAPETTSMATTLRVVLLAATSPELRGFDLQPPTVTTTWSEGSLRLIDRTISDCDRHCNYTTIMKEGHLPTRLLQARAFDDSTDVVHVKLGQARISRGTGYKRYASRDFQAHFPCSGLRRRRQCMLEHV